MAKETRGTESEVGEIVADGATKLAGLAAAAASASPIATAIVTRGAGAAAAALAKKAIGHFAESAQTRIQLWLENVGAAMRHGSADDVLREVTEQLDKPGVQDELLQVFRDLLATADQGVVPCIALLSAEYLLNDRRPDAFRRQMGGLLCDVTAAELPRLHSFLRKVVDSGDARRDSVLVVLFAPTLRDEQRVHDMDEIGRHAAVERGECEPVGFKASPDLTRFLWLLKKHGLAGEGPVAVGGSLSGSNLALVERPIIGRILQYLQPGVATQEAG